MKYDFEKEFETEYAQKGLSVKSSLGMKWSTPFALFRSISLAILFLIIPSTHHPAQSLLPSIFFSPVLP